MDALNQHSYHQATRLDTHRHCLDDKRKNYAWMNDNRPRERQHWLVANLRALRVSISILSRKVHPVHLDPSDKPAYSTATV